METGEISVSEFKVHCTEAILAVEKGDTILEPTRHGKQVSGMLVIDLAAIWVR